MASVNKQSLREEFDTLKARFEALAADGKMAAESRALFQAMLMLFEVLMAVFMEKRTAKDNSNSSLPSSQSTKEDDTATRPGRHTKGKAQNGARAGNTRTIETVHVAQVSVCETCGEDLSETPCHGHERRTRIDVIFEKVVSLSSDNYFCRRRQLELPVRGPGFGPWLVVSPRGRVRGAERRHGQTYARLVHGSRASDTGRAVGKGCISLAPWARLSLPGGGGRWWPAERTQKRDRRPSRSDGRRSGGWVADQGSSGATAVLDRFAKARLWAASAR